MSEMTGDGQDACPYKSIVHVPQLSTAGQMKWCITAKLAKVQKDQCREWAQAQMDKGPKVTTIDEIETSVETKEQQKNSRVRDFVQGNEGV